MQTANNTIIALDIGERRIGVAVANSIVRLPRPLITIENSATIWDDLRQLISSENAGFLVIGLPRGLEGQSTQQTKATKAFVMELKKHIDLPVHYQDEALTSVKAQEELRARKKPYKKGEIDALAAMYILEDFLNSNKG